MAARKTKQRRHHVPVMDKKAGKLEAVWKRTFTSMMRLYTKADRAKTIAARRAVQKKIDQLERKRERAFQMLKKYLQTRRA